MQLRFSIRYKILSMVTALLVAAIGFYLALATRVFQEDKLELVYDLNKSVVSTLATQVETTLRSTSDKLRFYVLAFDKNGNHNSKFFEDILTDDPFIVRLELFETSANHKTQKLSDVSSPEFSKIYGLDKDFFDQTLVSARPIPFESIESHSHFVWNATIKDGPPLIGLGIPVLRDGDGDHDSGKVMSAVAYLKADLFLKNLKSSKLTEAFIVGSDGHVLVHTQADIMIKGLDVSHLPIYLEMEKSPTSVGIIKYNVGQKSELGAYGRVATGNLAVISQVDGDKAFGAIEGLVRRSVLFALIISTITFIATIFFSRSLTRPLQTLMTAMEKVAGGSLDVELKVKSGDEIAVLAASFNNMTQDLKSSRLQLEEINRELENKVIDRTKKLEEQNRAVKEAQEALLRTTRLASVGEIAGRTAHEVLNPLTSIMARIQKVQRRLNDDVMNQKNLLGDIAQGWREGVNEKGLDGFLKDLEKPSSLDPKMTLLQEDINNINEIFSGWDKDLGTLDSDTQFLLQQATRIEKILKQMRSLSIVSSQKTKLPIHPILHDAVNILGDLFSKSHVKVIENFGANSVDCQVDRDELIQVLTNMLRNSLQAIVEKQKRFPKSGSITITTQNKDGKLLIDITDDGEGISEEHRAKLFEGQFSTKKPEVGTGLGLSISRRFVRAFNGDMYLLSTSRGEGTTFRIELPVVVTSKDVEGRAA